MKWYDYGVCLFFAELIASGFLGGNLLLMGSGLLGYDIYEEWRKRN